MGRDVLESAHHADLLAQDVPRLLGGRAGRWHNDPPAIIRVKRNRHIDKYLALELVFDALQGGDVGGVRNGQDNDIGRGRGTRIVRADQERSAQLLVKFGRHPFALLLLPRADNDLLTGQRPAERQPRSLFAGPAYNRNFHPCRSFQTQSKNSSTLPDTTGIVCTALLRKIRNRTVSPAGRLHSC